MRSDIRRAIQRLRAARLPALKPRPTAAAPWVGWYVEYTTLGTSMQTLADAIADAARDGIAGWMWWHHDPIRAAWPIAWDSTPARHKERRQRPPRRTVRRMKKARRR